MRRAAAILTLLCSCDPVEGPQPPSAVAKRVDRVVPLAFDVKPSPTAMREIRGGTYRPMFPGKDEPERRRVAGFMIDEHAVTNDQFLLFVKATPKWRRSQVSPLFANRDYLAHWYSDVDPGDGTGNRPVTKVSWFAARAYARWIGRRLPSVAEWEYVASASEDLPQGDRAEEHTRRILKWYSRPSTDELPPIKSTFRNSWGVHDLHGLIWEWVEDFNTALVTGESRGDTGLERTLFCGSGSIGSANPEDYASFMRFALRSSLKANYTLKSLGFRCAMDLPSK